MNKIGIITLIIVGVVLFVAGGVVGIFYQIQKDAPQALKAETTNSLASAVIPSIVAYGNVTRIEGRNITLSNSGDSLAVDVKDGAQVISFTNGAGSATGPVQQVASFNDVKVGSTINISVKVLPDGQLRGETIIILPSAGVLQ